MNLAIPGLEEVGDGTICMLIIAGLLLGWAIMDFKIGRRK